MCRVKILKSSLVHQITNGRIDEFLGRSGNFLDKVFEAVGVIGEIFGEVKVLGKAGGVELSENCQTSILEKNVGSCYRAYCDETKVLHEVWLVASKKAEKR